MNRLAFHPPLIAAFPVLSLYGANLSLVPLGHVWKPLGVALCASLALWLVFSLLLRGLRRGAVFASLASVAILGYGHMHRLWEILIQPLGEGSSPRVIVGLLVVAISLGVVFAWNEDRLEGATKFLNIVGVALLAASCGGIGWNILQRAEDSQVQPEGRKAELALGYAPDIFFVVLDGYARADVMKSHYGLDNSRFVADLKERGFQVASKSRTNYVQTQLSIASMLNLDYLEQVADIRQAGADRGVLTKPIRSSKTLSLLRTQGYVPLTVGTGYDPVLPTEALWSDRPATWGTLFDLMVLELTPLGRGDKVMKSNYQAHYERIRDALTWLGDLGPRSGSPRFVFAHILKPHPPFVLAPDGSFTKPSIRFGLFDATHYMEVGGTKATYREGYSKQVLGLNKLLLESIDRVLKQAKPAPVIILVSDHGPKMGYDQEEMGKTDLSEVVPNFVAVLVPPQAKFKLRDKITPVNLFREVSNALFKAGYERLPDKTFYSPWQQPFRFAEVKP